ncbi:Predicted dehydrogenase [Reichenbachiella faecimaris]|uniref:Predicted dehydrogenase n=1 Tax=Reichenbachiella faecimaris TaxID=692418 RepID=A0A1W2GPL0_REIFA|nr:Gfo/Idh/MocA family oxidoreductase [Reichenbachiella faecimaris]SMD38288.1 Predicted dehydrogenase [Reichenbachiella faecimaris]
MKRRILLGFLLGIMCLHTSSAQQNKPLKIGVIGLTHTHVHWILGRPKADDIQIVGIVEPNKALAQRYADQHGYSMDLVYDTMEEMIKATQPVAVTAFGAIYEHLAVVETCAPKGIHVMVEKPLAVSMEHAIKMEALAKKHNIHLLTNYETTWYATNHKAYDMVNQGEIGDLRKIVVHDGHKGPIELGINSEFIDWLTDPIANGGGAVVDFGCYGANLITWMTHGQKPEQVMAMTQTIKPDVYTKVDDEATIVLKYPKMQGIIQASWNWPIARKDLEVYGQTGYIYSDNRSDLRYRLSEEQVEKSEKLTARTYPYNDPFALLAAVVKGEVTLPPFALSSLENNLIVVEILDAARESAQTGRTIELNP